MLAVPLPRTTSIQSRISPYTSTSLAHAYREPGRNAYSLVAPYSCKSRRTLRAMVSGSMIRGTSRLGTFTSCREWGGGLAVRRTSCEPSCCVVRRSSSTSSLVSESAVGGRRNMGLTETRTSTSTCPRIHASLDQMGQNRARGAIAALASTSASAAAATGLGATQMSQPVSRGHILGLATRLRNQRSLAAHRPVWTTTSLNLSTMGRGRAYRRGAGAVSYTHL